MKKRVLLCINPHSRRGEGARQQARAMLQAAGLEVILPADALSIQDAIAHHASETDCVVIGGGDGSLNAAADALCQTGLPLGILPLGTANDLARTLNIPADMARACAVIAAGKMRKIDLGVVNDKPFFNVASIGFSVSLAKRLTAESKRRWGVLGYAFAALGIFRQSRPFSVMLEHNGQREIIKTIQISVGNGRYYGGGMTVEQQAAPDDGQLDVYSLELDHWWELLLLTPSLRRGTQGKWRKVRAFPATALQVTPRRPHTVNADGELVTTTPAHFSVRPGAVSVCVP